MDDHHPHGTANDGPEAHRPAPPMDERTARALSVLPPALAETYANMWRVDGNLVVVSDMIIRTAAAFEHERAERGTPQVTHYDNTISDAVRAQSSALAAKRALIKSVRAIDEYDGRIQDDAARKYLRDCERYFREITQFAGAQPEEYDKVIRASGALKGRAAQFWKRHEQHIAVTDPSQEVRTFTAYKAWIEREFSEHLGGEKRWDRFQKCRQGDRTFIEYATDLQEAAAECGIEISEAVLIQFLRKGAKTQLQKRWAEDQTHPTRLAEVIERFIQFEQGAMIAGYLEKRSRNSNPRGNQRDPDAMDLDVLKSTNESKDSQRKETRRCFNCNKIGHLKQDCRSPKKRWNENSGNTEKSKN